ncbi:MAG: glutamate--tRNA ligase [Patescibacteria group bacterium]|nr:glutamate--tRNA ligase [Patescibacteria group bacterium]
MSTSTKIKTRFAPSPTGFLHVGGLRTALYNYLFAKQNDGEFMLRIEDTDQSRKVEGAIENLKDVLARFNLNWDNQPMIQSERLKKYRDMAEVLIKEDKAYYCFCTTERLEQLRSQQIQRKLPPMYDGQCRNLSSDECSERIKKGEPHVIRFKMPKTGNTEFVDIVRGKVNFDNKILDDQVIIKSDGFPTYHLASVVDDHEMSISHVIRGEEWLSSTPKHILLYQAFGWDSPQFAHLPLLLNPDKSKLSKRQGDVAVEDYLTQGYLPEALLNFVLLLGWNPGDNEEIFDLTTMAKTFDLQRVHKSGAVFNIAKLDWLNSHYIKLLTPKKLAELSLPFYEKANIKTKKFDLEKIVLTEQPRIKKLSELPEATGFFFANPNYDPGLLIWKKTKPQHIMVNLKLLIDILEPIKIDDWTAAKIEKIIKAKITENNIGTGDVLWPMRVALSGRKASPGPFEIADALGQAVSLQRLKTAIALLEK